MLTDHRFIAHLNQSKNEKKKIVIIICWSLLITYTKKKRRKIHWKKNDLIIELKKCWMLNKWFSSCIELVAYHNHSNLDYIQIWNRGNETKLSAITSLLTICLIISCYYLLEQFERNAKILTNIFVLLCVGGLNSNLNIEHFF